MGQRYTEPANRMHQVDLQPNIGLEDNDRRAVGKILKQALSMETGLTIRTRFAYWNLRGREYVELRSLLSSHFEQLNQIIEKLAERVQIQGDIVTDSLREFLETFTREDLQRDVPDIKELLAVHEAAIRSLRKDVKKCSEEFGDEGTRQFLVEILFQHEKLAWSLRSYLEP